MARFQFHLNALLAVREATRDQRRVRLAEAQAKDRTLKERRAVLELDLGQQQTSMRSGTLPGRLDIDRVTAAHRYCLIVRRELEILSASERALAIEIELGRDGLIAADREVQVLEKLRQRQHEEFQRQQALLDTKQLDEVAARTMRRDDS